MMKKQENAKNPPKNGTEMQWQKVKITGHVISDDGGGLEGLVGLEVLEDYDKNLVAKEKKSKRQLYKESKELKKLMRKSEIKDFVEDHDSSDEELKEPAEKKAKKSKKKLEKTQPIIGQFVKAPIFSDEQIIEQTENIPPSDELIGWNGLGVPEVILRAMAEKGFKTPTEIQALTLPAAIMGKRDILGAAETGSGKTLAFGIPILTGILELKRRNVKTGIRKKKLVKQQKPKQIERDNLTPPPEELEGFPELDTADEAYNSEEEPKDSETPLYALVLTPTRELCVQVKDHLVAAAKYTGIKIAAIFGGMAAVKQERILAKCPEVVVATPGRLWELIGHGNRHLEKIDDVSFLVIDETDRMVEKGHFEEFKLLLTRLNSDESKKDLRQNFVFSATLTLVHDLPDYLKKKNMGKKNKLVKHTPGMKIQKLIEELGISQPKIVDITSSNQTANSLTECRLVCSFNHKDYYLYYFLQMHPGRTIVFCNSIDCVKRLAQLFSLLDCKPLPLHANMIQKQRLKNLERFTENPRGLLIATDVAARGLDIQNVQHVIHYQVPRTSENYVHRSGRTARANKDGITVIIMEPGEIQNYLKMCRTLDRSEDLPLFPVSEKYLSAVKERVNVAREVDILELRLRRTLSEAGWLQKNAEEMEMIVDGNDDESDVDKDDDDLELIESSKQKRLLTQRRQQLAMLLSKPTFPKGFSYKYPTSTGQLMNPFFNSEPSTENSAVNVMKDAIEENRLAKKRKNKKKPKTTHANQK